MIPTLYYDSSCPICSGFASLLKRKIASGLNFESLNDSSANEFKYLNKNGALLSGDIALDALLADFPQVEDYFWMLPKSMKKNAVKTVVSTASVIRQALNKVKPCNCGKR